jgi:hypothetical protein
LERGYDVMVGYDNLIFGKQVESSGGTDGILAGDKRLNPHEAKVDGVNADIPTPPSE